MASGFCQKVTMIQTQLLTLTLFLMLQRKIYTRLRWIFATSAMVCPVVMMVSIDIAYTPELLKVFDDRACRVQQKMHLKLINSPNFFDGEVASTVCKQTNRYAASLIADPEYTKKKEKAIWVDITIDEVCTFIALVCLNRFVCMK